MKRRELLAAALAVVAPGAVGAGQKETKYALAAPQRVTGHCPLPSCGALNQAVVQDVRWNEAQLLVVNVTCTRCTNTYGIGNRQWKEATGHAL